MMQSDELLDDRLQPLAALLRDCAGARARSRSARAARGRRAPAGRPSGSTRGEQRRVRVAGQRGQEADAAPGTRRRGRPTRTRAAPARGSMPEPDPHAARRRSRGRTTISAASATTQASRVAHTPPGRAGERHHERRRRRRTSESAIGSSRRCGGAWRAQRPSPASRGRCAASTASGTSAGRQQDEHRHERELDRPRVALADLELDQHAARRAARSASSHGAQPTAVGPHSAWPTAASTNDDARRPARSAARAAPRGGRASTGLLDVIELRRELVERESPLHVRIGARGCAIEHAIKRPVTSRARLDTRPARPAQGIKADARVPMTVGRGPFALTSRNAAQTRRSHRICHLIAGEDARRRGRARPGRPARRARAGQAAPSPTRTTASRSRR